MMIDQKPFQQVQEATSDVVSSLHKTSQAVVDSVITIQNYHLRFAQNLFLSWMELLTHQTESIQHVQQQWGQQTQQQQEAFQKLASGAMETSLNILRPWFSFSQQIGSVPRSAGDRELQFAQDGA